MNKRRDWLKQVAASGLLALALMLGQPAQAQGVNPKISNDLAAVLAAPAGSSPTVPWARKLGGNGALYVQVLVNANSSDSTLAALRQDILARGGSVHYNYISQETKVKTRLMRPPSSG